MPNVPQRMLLLNSRVCTQPPPLQGLQVLTISLSISFPKKHVALLSIAFPKKHVALLALARAPLHGYAGMLDL